MFDNNDNAVLSTESGVTRNVVSAVDKHSITSPPRVYLGAEPTATLGVADTSVPSPPSS